MIMLKHLKKVFKTKSEKELELAAADFDELMSNVYDDHEGAVKLDKHKG